MISLRRIAIKGEAVPGPFEGQVTLGAGLQLFSGPNSYGKSLLASTVAWCLGLEPMYGVRAGDNTIFSEGARERLKTDGVYSQVKTSHGELDIQVGDATLTFMRPIAGGDSKYIHVYDHQTKRSTKLLTGYGSMADQTGGFQNRFFEWAQMPTQRIMSAQGRESVIYLENLAPLFFVEQLDGWTELQGLQVRRYQLVEIQQAAFEYILGLDGRLADRFARQSASAHEDALRTEATGLLRRINSFLVSNGLEGVVRTRGALKDLAEFFGTLKLSDYLRDVFGWSFADERSRLVAEIKELQNQLNEGATAGLSEQGPVSERASTKVLDLKQAITATESELRTLRQQLSSQKQLVFTLEERIKSAGDLLRLKQSGIGVPTQAECPTCHQHVEPAAFDLASQDIEGVRSYIQTLERDREALVRSLAKAEVQAEALAGRLRRAEDEYYLAQQQLQMVNAAVGPGREALVEVAGRIVAAERLLDRNRAAARDASELQELISDVAKKLASALDTPARTDEAGEDQVLRHFVATLGAYLRDISHSAVPADGNGNIALDDDYGPLLDGRPLRLLGSASDRARIVLAYTLALMRVALERKGHHPGFALYDEPLQQNPDEPHREKFRQFIASAWKAIPGQVVIFTSLSKEDEAFFRERGVPFTKLAGDKLLKLSASAA